MLIEGKVTIVSGGGISRAAVLALAERGANVVIGDINDVAGQYTVSLTDGKRGTAIFVQCNVINKTDLVKGFEHTIDSFGQLDFVFNNAGIGGVGLFGDIFKRLDACDRNLSQCCD